MASMLRLGANTAPFRNESPIFPPQPLEGSYGEFGPSLRAGTPARNESMGGLDFSRSNANPSGRWWTTLEGGTSGLAMSGFGRLPPNSLTVRAASGRLSALSVFL